MNTILDLFAGPGGWDMGAQILGLPPIHGVDLDRDACATARAAGFWRSQLDVAELDPAHHDDVTGLIASPPCPTFSAAGRRTGVADEALLRRAIDLLGGDGIDEEAWRRVTVQDPRSALLLETLRFAAELPNLEWLVAEQVPAVEPLWQWLAAELAAFHRFGSVAVVTLDAEELGIASRRRRTFLIGARHDSLDLSGLPGGTWWQTGRYDSIHVHVSLTPAVFPQTSMAQALGWPRGHRVNTRGNRRTSGGNEFAADGPAWCLTEKARTWKRVADGTRLTPSDAGLLVGFPADYPWQGSRSRQFLQAADVVAPPVAAAVLGAALGLEWVDAVRKYVDGLYRPSRAGVAA